MQRIVITADTTVPVDKLFAFLSEQENMARLFAPAKVTRLRDGDSSRNGVGSVRQVKIPLSPAIEETNTVFEENRRIEYRVTNKAAIKNHLGVMEFVPTAGGSQLRYTITFDGRVPLTGVLIKVALQATIKRNIAKLNDWLN